MGKEIERKFLVLTDEFKSMASPEHYRQGYLVKDGLAVRVRVVGTWESSGRVYRGYLTIKSKASGLTRLEYEYEIPAQDAYEMLDMLCLPGQVEKNRYKIKVGEVTWEVDEFFGDNKGLVVAEVELKSEDQKFDKPSWIGEEVSKLSCYLNANLISNPFKNWKKS